MQGSLLRPAGALLVAGMALSFVTGALHPSGEDPNDHTAVFAEYARDESWRAVHLGQFAGALVVIAGLIVLHRALMQTARVDTLAWLALAAAISTAVALAVLQAVDGVVLKEAVDAWWSAGPGERQEAFRSAELIRWTEWGANAYFRVLEGITAILYGAAAARAGLVAPALGATAVLAGVGYLAAGVIVAHVGFSEAALTIGAAMDPLFLLFAVGIVLAGRRAGKVGTRA